MSATQGRKDMRPTARSIISGLAGITALMSMVYAKDELRGGLGLGGALKVVWTSRDFWIGMMLPLTVFMVVFPWLAYWLYQKVLLRPVGEEGSSAATRRRMWRRIQTLNLVAVVGILAQTGFMFARAYAKLHSVGGALSRVSFMLAYAAFVIFAFVVALRRPSDERARAMETGDRSRLYDERFHEVVSRSARTAMLVIIGMLFVVGSAVDMLVYHQLPVRAWLEGFGALIIWQAAYSYWDKRI